MSTDEDFRAMLMKKGQDLNEKMYKNAVINQGNTIDPSATIISSFNGVRYDHIPENRNELDPIPLSSSVYLPPVSDPIPLSPSVYSPPVSDPILQVSPPLKVVESRIDRKDGNISIDSNQVFTEDTCTTGGKFTEFSGSRALVDNIDIEVKEDSIFIKQDNLSVGEMWDRGNISIILKNGSWIATYGNKVKITLKPGHYNFSDGVLNRR